MLKIFVEKDFLTNSQKITVVFKEIHYYTYSSTMTFGDDGISTTTLMPDDKHTFPSISLWWKVDEQLLWQHFKSGSEKILADSIFDMIKHHPEVAKRIGVSTDLAARLRIKVFEAMGIKPPGFSLALDGPVLTKNTPAKPVDPDTLKIMKAIPDLKVKVGCPAHGKPGQTPCEGSLRSVWYQVQHLNDWHMWSRETQIADWLDTLDLDLEFGNERETESL